MPKGQYLNPHQKGIVRRYYEHRNDLMIQKLGEIVSELMIQKLGEIVSELYLCDDPKKTDRLWERAEKALLNAEAPKPQVEVLMKSRDLKSLARLVNELF